MVSQTGPRSKAIPSRHVGHHPIYKVTDLYPDKHRQQQCEVCGTGYRTSFMCKTCKVPLCLEPREDRRNSSLNCDDLYHNPEIPDYTIYRLSKATKAK